MKVDDFTDYKRYQRSYEMLFLYENDLSVICLSIINRFMLNLHAIYLKAF